MGHEDGQDEDVEGEDDGNPERASGSVGSHENSPRYIHG
jgi:hypothetical protein